jgi:hypothetical protein
MVGIGHTYKWRIKKLHGTNTIPFTSQRLIDIKEI